MAGARSGVRGERNLRPEDDPEEPDEEECGSEVSEETEYPPGDSAAATRSIARLLPEAVPPRETSEERMSSGSLL